MSLHVEMRLVLYNSRRNNKNYAIGRRNAYAQAITRYPKLARTSHAHDPILWAREAKSRKHDVKTPIIAASKTLLFKVDESVILRLVSNSERVRKVCCKSATPEGE